MLHILAKLNEYRRVLRVARKPTKEEFMSSGKICLIGILLIGAIGFIITIAFMLAGV